MIPMTQQLVDPGEPDWEMFLPDDEETYPEPDDFWIEPEEEWDRC